ncbi:SRPBCC domain-containing protein [Nesterenkonia ebinurensis]|uniref:SRPBCC domain-containing protein n=1 Tax=Nesterenkonia ebinurensis TaxID=2608252 RepID=UPI00123D51E1|nr:SRPBCC domain-containing protein [Nesterenkonia ebinurensis]
MTVEALAGFADMRVDGDRGSVRFARRISTSLADAWNVVTEPERITRWFAPVSVEGKQWVTYWDGDECEYAKGEILRCEPQQLIEVSWQASDDAVPLVDTVLRVTLTPEDDAVLLVLEHEQLLAADLSQYGPGWHTYLDRLPDGDPNLDWSARYRELKPQYEELIKAS